MKSIPHQSHFLAALFGLFVVVSVFAKDELAAGKLTTLLPDNIQSFRATQPAGTQIFDGMFKKPVPDLSVLESAAMRGYTNDAGVSFSLELARAKSDSAAYALLTQLAAKDQPIEIGKIGTASFDNQDRITFYRGDVLAQIGWVNNSQSVHDEMRKVASAYAASLPTSEDDVPVLEKHLPEGVTSAHPIYAVSLKMLESITSYQPILDAISFDGGTEAVVADYGSAKLLVIEFTTPQMSIDNDSRIWTKIAELKSQGQPTPSAYRRIGNYSVFVFNAPDEKTANALIDQVKYEQVVQWLGDDPHLYEKLQKYLTNTSAGVLIAVLKSSGLSLVLCLGVGGLIGALLFRHRRAQRAAAFSDAGGSIRLNLDELTETANARHLLPPADRSNRDASS